MNKHVKEFLHRGMLAAWGGPVILAIIYGILGATGAVETLLPAEVCRGVLSVTLMAFVAGGISMIYSMEKLPVAMAALIHGGILYLDYLIMYLFNSWIPRNTQAILIFTAIFVAVYAAIWLGIYITVQKRTRKLNERLHEAGK